MEDGLLQCLENAQRIVERNARAPLFPLSFEGLQVLCLLISTFARSQAYSDEARIFLPMKCLEAATLLANALCRMFCAAMGSVAHGGCDLSSDMVYRHDVFTRLCDVYEISSLDEAFHAVAMHVETEETPARAKLLQLSYDKSDQVPLLYLAAGYNVFCRSFVDALTDITAGLAHNTKAEPHALLAGWPPFFTDSSALRGVCAAVEQVLRHDVFAKLQQMGGGVVASTPVIKRAASLLRRLSMSKGCLLERTRVYGVALPARSTLDVTLTRSTNSWLNAELEQERRFSEDSYADLADFLVPAVKRL